MPRVAQILDQFLLEHEGQPNFLVWAAAAVLVSFYFGWRSSTVAALKVQSVYFITALNVFRFTEEFSKGSFATL